jgi:multiple sugar transport system substrate-binding protein
VEIFRSSRAGLDFFSLPHLFPQKCVDVSDVAEYLSKKYRGWVASAIPYGKGKADKWIDLPTCWSGNAPDRRSWRAAA